MFDFLRDRGSTAEDRHREALSAYLDNALTAAERERLEGQLARDATLRAELERMRVLKLQLRAMPRRRVPRSFALDPALYGRPKAQPMMQLYPVLRGATALTAFLLIFTLALGAFRNQSFDGAAPESVAVTESMAIEEAESFDAAAATTGEELRGSATAAPQMETAMEAPVEAPAPESAAGITGIPEEGLDIEQGTLAPEPTLAIAAVEVTAVASAEDQSGAGAVDPAEVTNTGDDQSVQKEEGTFSTLFGPLQIGLGVTFLILLIFWLIVRRRLRSLP